MSSEDVFAFEVGVCHAVVLPFVRSTGKGYDWSNPQLTGPYRYLKMRGGRASFITHFRWTIGGSTVEVSRVEAVDAWIKAANFHNLGLELVLMMGTLPKGHDGYHLDPDLRAVFHALKQFYFKISNLLMYHSEFLRRMTEIESAGIVHPEWPPFAPADFIRRGFSHHIDTAQPTTVWAYLLLRVLQRAMDDESREMQFVQAVLGIVKARKWRVPAAAMSIIRYENGWNGEVIVKPVRTVEEASRSAQGPGASPSDSVLAPPPAYSARTGPSRVQRTCTATRNAFASIATLFSPSPASSSSPIGSKQPLIPIHREQEKWGCDRVL